MQPAILETLKRGFALQRSGSTAAAEAAYRDVLASDPDNVHALNLLGVLCVNSDRAEEAAALIGRALRLVPDDPEAHLNLGLALKDLNRPARAAEAFRTAARLAPDKALASAYLAGALYELGEFEAAAAAARRALALAPDLPPALVNLARSLAQCNRLEEAEAAARRALRSTPDAAAPLTALGDILIRACRYDEAVAVFRRAQAAPAATIEALLGEASAHEARGEPKDAAAALQQAITQWPQDGRGYFALGVLAEQSGDIEGARSALTEAARRDPRDAAAHYQLAQLPGGRVSEADREGLETLFADPESTREQKRFSAFAVARALEQAGGWEAALDWFARGHAIISSGRAYDDAAMADFYGRIISADAGLARAPPPPSGTPTPVLIVGMPRSGTSLTEQILASHPDVAATGESSFLQDAVSAAQRRTGCAYPAGLNALAPDVLAEIGEAYCDRLARHAGGARFITDKTPMNFQYLGFARAILPDVRIVHCVRDPVDTCLSIFRLPFDRDQTYAHSLESLATFHGRYRALMARWRTILGERMIDVRYEDLVGDLETQARRLLDHLGLPFDARVLAFHETERVVRTPSANQVRRPIYRDSLEAWRRYGPRAAALAERLRADEATG